MESQGFLLEDQVKSGKLEIFFKKSWKRQGRKFYPCKFLTSIKNHMDTDMWAVELYMAISCIYDAIIFSSSIKMI